MISIDKDEWCFLNEWGETIGEESQLIKEMNKQIEELAIRLDDWSEE